MATPREDAGPGQPETTYDPLRDEDPDARLAAVRALADIGDPAATPTLVRLAEDDPDDEVRVEAVIALDRLGYVDPVLDDGLPRTVREEVEDRRRGRGRPLGLTWRRVRRSLVALTLLALGFAIDLGFASLALLAAAVIVGLLWLAVSGRPRIEQWLRDR